MWVAFVVIVLAALSVDLLVLRQRGPHKVSAREALLWSVAWVGLAGLFNLALWGYLHQLTTPAEADRIALEFLTGYLVEKTLAVDNIFVFLMVFSYFAVPEEQRQKVLIIGVLGAIALRAIMIFAGALLLAEIPLGALFLRRVPAAHRSQDALGRGQDTRPRATTRC